MPQPERTLSIATDRGVFCDGGGPSDEGSNSDMKLLDGWEGVEGGMSGSGYTVRQKSISMIRSSSKP